MKRTVFLICLALQWAPALAASQFDGQYIGQRTIVRGAPPTCPANGPASWHIANGRYSYRFWAGNLPVQVADDGTLKGQYMYSASRGTHWFLDVKGTIANGALEADAEWRACQMHYSLRKK
jgi:hypothetical protein